jgi:hypothetical protein
MVYFPEISTILKRSNLALIDQEFASRPLPETIVDSMRGRIIILVISFYTGYFKKPTDV